MTRDLQRVVIGPESTLIEALQAIDREGIELVFVADKGGRIIGTLSDGDVRRQIIKGVALDAVGAVGNAMRKDFLSVKAEVNRTEALDAMRVRRISQLPVLDDDGMLVGLHLLHELIGAVDRSNCAVIMAGGQGARLRPLTENVPKPMLTVAGRPILERLVLHLVGFGISEIYLSINYLGHVIENHFGDGSQFGCKIRYLREEEPLGTGGPLSLLPELEQPVLVMNGDLVTQANVDRILSFHDEGGFVATSCLRPYQIEVPFGVAEVRGRELVAFREKPTEQLLINAGIYVLSKRALQMIPKGREFPITDVFEDCLKQALPVGAHVLEGDWMDVGRYEELKKARGIA